MWTFHSILPESTPIVVLEDFASLHFDATCDVYFINDKATKKLVCKYSARAVADLFNNSSPNSDQYYLSMYITGGAAHVSGMLHGIPSVWIIQAPAPPLN